MPKHEHKWVATDWICDAPECKAHVRKVWNPNDSRRDYPAHVEVVRVKVKE